MLNQLLSLRNTNPYIGKEGWVALNCNALITDSLQYFFRRLTHGKKIDRFYSEHHIAKSIRDLIKIVSSAHEQDSCKTKTLSICYHRLVFLTHSWSWAEEKRIPILKKEGLLCPRLQCINRRFFASSCTFRPQFSLGRISYPWNTYHCIY